MAFWKPKAPTQWCWECGGTLPNEGRVYRALIIHKEKRYLHEHCARDIMGDGRYWPISEGEP